jgi:lysophospholipase L1-like esterase
MVRVTWRGKFLSGLLVAVTMLALVEAGLWLALRQRLARLDDAQTEAEGLHRALTQSALAEQEEGDGRVLVTAIDGYHSMRVVIPKPAGVFRVVLIGDSTPWGMIGGVDESQDTRDISLQGHLERMLPLHLGGRAEVIDLSLQGHLERLFPTHLGGRPVEVINLGLPGSISDVALARAREALRVEPDLALVYVGANDSNQELVRATLEPGFRSRGWLRRRIYLAELIARALTTPRRTSRAAVARGPLLETNLRALVVLMEHRVPLLVCLPVVRDRAAHADTRDRIARATVGTAARVVDVVRAFDDAARARGVAWDRLFSDEMHPTVDGHRVLAEAVIAAASHAGMLGRR